MMASAEESVQRKPSRRVFPRKKKRDTKFYHLKDIGRRPIRLVAQFRGDIGAVPSTDAPLPGLCSASRQVQESPCDWRAPQSQ